MDIFIRKGERVVVRLAEILITFLIFRLIMSKKRRLRNSESMLQRDDSGKYLRGCNCLLHESWSNDELFAVKHIVKSRQFNMSIISLMKERKLLTPYAVNLCTACYNHFKKT